MEDEAQAKILQLLDVISVEVAANRNDTSELRGEMRAGFGRVERRLGNLEIRVENVETELRVVQTDLRSFRGEFERRIAPLER
jgi:predicted  nucleic acid-binding Zn-ribbon protein